MTPPESKTPSAQSLAPQSRVRLAAKAMLKTDKVSGGRMLLYPEGALALNPTGAAIVDLCDGRRALAEMVATLAEQFNAPPEALMPDVSQYIATLRERGLVEILTAE